MKCKNKFLLLERNKQPNKGKFVPVGGKIDPFETPYDAVIRETEEETGLKLLSVKFCGILSESSPTDYNWVSFIYTADIDFIDPPYCDEGSLVWVDESELDQINAPQTDAFIYKYIAEQKIFAFSAQYDFDLKLISMKDEFTNTLVFNL